MPIDPRESFIEEDDCDASTVLMAGSQRQRFLADLETTPTPRHSSEAHGLLEIPLVADGSLESPPRGLPGPRGVPWAAVVGVAALAGLAAAGILWAI